MFCLINTQWNNYCRSNNGKNPKKKNGENDKKKVLILQTIN